MNPKNCHADWTRARGDSVSEHDEQAAFFQWCNQMSTQHPILSRFYAIPNGGKRAIKTALYLKAEGVKSGVLDTHLPIARGRYIGLWIEFKFGKNKLTQEQEDWLNFLRAEFHRVEVVYEWTEAAHYALEYLGLDDGIPF